MSYRGGNGTNLVALSRQRRDEISAALAELGRQREQHQKIRAELEASFREALRALIEALVPRLEANALGWAAWATGYPAIDPPRVFATMEGERQRLTDRAAQIEAEPSYVQRELLRAPRVGTLTRQIAELEQFRAPLADVLARCAHPRMERLVEVFYGMPEYSVGFWRASYYADWKAGDEILEKFGEGKTFAQVRSEYIAARDACPVYDAKLAELYAEVHAGEALEAEHTRCREGLRTLEQRYLANVRDALWEHLSTLDLAVIGPRLATAPHVDVLARRVAGIAAKRTYIDGVAYHYLNVPEADLRRSLDKMNHEIIKWSRPKRAYQSVPAHVLEQRSRSLAPRFTKSSQRFQKTYTKIYHFHDYDRGRLVQDFLWWDLMTDGRVDGDFIPEIRGFRERNPSYVYTPASHDDHDDAAAAAALASIETPDDDGGAHLVDAS